MHAAKSTIYKILNTDKGHVGDRFVAISQIFTKVFFHISKDRYSKILYKIHIKYFEYEQRLLLLLFH